MRELWQYTQEEFSEMFSIINESFAERFGQSSTAGPEMVLKSGVVIVVLVVGYIIIFPIYCKVNYLLSWERKRDLAISRGHVIEAKRVKYAVGAGDDDSHATYEYIIENQRKVFRALFINRYIPPETLQLYWIDNPRKVFAMEDYHYDVFSRGIPLLFLIALPWILAGLAFYLLM